MLLLAELWQIDLHDVGTQLHRHAGRVLDCPRGELPALGVDRLAARIRPDDYRHPEPLRLLPHLRELHEVAVLRR